MKDIRTFSPVVAFAIVSFCLGELGDGLNIFQVRKIGFMKRLRL